MKKIILKSWFIILILVMAEFRVQGELLQVENFDTQVNHIDNKPASGVLGGFWDTQSNGTGNVNLETQNGSMIVRFMTTTAGDGRGIAFAGITNPIENTEKGLVFFRFYIRAGQVADTFIGLHPLIAMAGTDDFLGSAQNNNPANYIAAGFHVIDDGSSMSLVRATADAAVIAAGLSRAQWYNCWIEADNAADTFDLYISTATGPAGPATLPALTDKVGEDLPFVTATDNPLTGVLFVCPTRSNQSARTYIDEIYWDGDRGLASLIAQDPSPANNAINIAVDTNLSWVAPDDPTIAEIQSYDVYMDPNQTKVINRDPSVLKSAAQPGTSYDPISNLTFDKTYYWCVDTTVLLTPEADPNQIPVVEAGSVWSFTTKTPAPEIVENPVNVLIDAGNPAMFMVLVSSPHAPETYQWYSSTDPANNTPADDVQIDGAVTNTYEIPLPTTADEKYYYCKVSNVYNGKTSTVYSNAAALGIKRNVAYWTLDNLVGGHYEDSSGEGHHADPNGSPIFVAGVNPAITNNSVQIDASGGWANAGTWNPSQYSGQLTLSLWVKWAGQPTTPVYQGLIGKRNVYASNMMWQLEIGNNAASILTFKSNINGVTSPILPVDEWEQVVVAYDGTTATIYRNGTYANSGPVTLNDGMAANMMIGAVGQDPGLTAPTSIMNGQLDDIKIYNYALDPVTIAYSFTDIDPLGRTACINPNDPVLVKYDLDGNCEVGLSDLVDLASHWLTGQLVPDVVDRP